MHSKWKVIYIINSPIIIVEQSVTKSINNVTNKTKYYTYLKKKQCQDYYRI